MAGSGASVRVLDRVSQSIAGAVAALALWALGETWSEPAIPDLLRICLLTFVLVQSGVALTLAAPLGLARSMWGGFILSLPATLLALSAGSRFEPALKALDHPELVSVLAVFVFVLTPFVAVWLRDRDQWLDYACLFETAWEITARFLLAWLFLALVWMVLFLSDALLNLVDIGLVDLVFRTDWLVFGLSGAVLGLGLAVIYEVRDRVSPFPALRLLRMLVPVFLVVIVLFLAVLPFRGLTGLFGDLSSAGILLVSASVAITLVSTALDRDDAHGVQTPGLTIATRGLAVLIPLLVGLSAWALAVRVLGYGWTPDRLLAALGACLLMAYATGYAVCALVGGAWRDRVRRLNIAMALTLALALALWLSPVFDGFRVASASQVGRYEAHLAETGELPIWEMAHEWGHAGQQGLDRLQAIAERREDLIMIDTIARARRIDSRYQFSDPELLPTPETLIPELLAKMPVAEGSRRLSADDLTGIPVHHLKAWQTGCARTLPGGTPGCLFLRGAFSPAVDETEQALVLFLADDGLVRITHLLRGPSGDISLRHAAAETASEEEAFPVEVLAAAQAGRFEIIPSGRKALSVAGQVISPRD
ncbi:DUF4153 domain-containing protein [Ruegeria marina]|uniref:DUF4153 domain-containing protein n=1 Tax=Ruegeria marina TaxID=639004 RepID=A0A1G6VCY9_9RHOB|nr:DUF4153 domain-containing protein [Ruegeria marina]SDD51381.1 protein of unknown function [Ruegeria marina]